METNTVNKLYEKAHKNLLIDKFEVLDLINNSSLAEKEFVVVMIAKKRRNKDEIMPTLCLIKPKTQKMFFAQSKDDLTEKIETIFNGFGIKTEKESTAYELLDIKFKKSIYFKKSKAKLYFNENILDTELELLDISFNFLRQNSPNMLNESLNISLIEAKKIEQRYSDSIQNTAKEINQYIIENYKYDCKLFNLSEEEYKNDKLVSENIDHLTDFGRSLYLQDDEDITLLFPFINDRKSVKIEHIFKIKSNKNPISKYLIINLTKSFNYYFNSYIPRLIINHISDLQNHIIRIHYDTSLYIEEINLRKLLKEFSDVAFLKIVQNSGAHSATLRFYDPFEKKLLLISEVQSYKGERNENTHIDISIKDNSSINALTFRHCNKAGFLFLKDIQEYKGGLKPFDRLSSKSELCFPLYFKQIKIGTINFESPSEDGFGTQLLAEKKIKKNVEHYKNDTTFNIFFAVKKLLEQYAEILFDSSDKLWLSKRIHIYQNIHELKALSQAKDLNSSYKQTIENAIYLSQQTTSKKSLIDLFGSIKLFYERFILDIKSQSVEVARVFLESKIFLKNSVKKEIIISNETYSFLEILFKNIFSNFHKNINKFCDDECITIWLVKEVLYININFVFNGYSESNLHKYLVRPFSDIRDRSEKMHYGLFLIGMITRHLKGFFHIKPPETDNSLTKIVINIPFKELS